MELQEAIQTLNSFTGTENYYQHVIGNKKMYLTDGCAFVRQEFKAYWLFDLILSYQCYDTIKEEEFQVWLFEKKPDSSMNVTCSDGNKHKIIEQFIEFTDFPIDTFNIWYSQGVAMLPSEY